VLDDIKFSCALTCSSVCGFLQGTFCASHAAMVLRCSRFWTFFCLSVKLILQFSRQADIFPLGFKSSPSKVHYCVHKRSSLGLAGNSVSTLTPCVFVFKTTSPAALLNCYNTIYANTSTPPLHIHVFFPLEYCVNFPVSLYIQVLRVPPISLSLILLP
jgi:hypothetical protein